MPAVWAPPSPAAIRTMQKAGTPPLAAALPMRPFLMGPPSPEVSNTAGAEDAIIGGGLNNNASGFGATIGGGVHAAAGENATVGGGRDNSATDLRATVGGGTANTAALYDTVGGGLDNHARDAYSTVGGGTSKQQHGLRGDGERWLQQQSHRGCCDSAGNTGNEASGQDPSPPVTLPMPSMLAPSCGATTRRLAFLLTPTDFNVTTMRCRTDHPPTATSIVIWYRDNPTGAAAAIETPRKISLR